MKRKSATMTHWACLLLSNLLSWYGYLTSLSMEHLVKYPRVLLVAVSHGLHSKASLSLVLTFTRSLRGWLQGCTWSGWRRRYSSLSSFFFTQPPPDFRAESDPSRSSITSLTQSGVLTTQLQLTQGRENGLSRGLIQDGPLPALVHRELSLSHTHCLIQWPTLASTAWTLWRVMALRAHPPGERSIATFNRFMIFLLFYVSWFFTILS
jgi:hypothetical protein